MQRTCLKHDLLYAIGLNDARLCGSTARPARVQTLGNRRTADRWSDVHVNAVVPDSKQLLLQIAPL